MKVLLIPSVAIGLLCGGSALFAQQPNRMMTITAPSRAAASVASRQHEENTSLDPHFSYGEMTPTPEMWFYEQRMREYRNPKNAVRRRAEFEADQRQQRLAAMDWYGFSNSRPYVSPTPFVGAGPYSPSWIGNSAVPYQWNGASRPVIVVPANPTPSRSAYGLW